MTGYEYNPDLNLSIVDYINVGEVNENLTLEYDPHFGQEVFAEESGVHIPIEIYEGCECNLVFCHLLTLVQVWRLIGHCNVYEGDLSHLTWDNR